MSRKVLITGTLLAVAAALTACTGGGSATSSTPAANTSAAAGSTPAGGIEQVYENVVREVLPSVVQITAGSSSGSGVVYDTNGDIVTNAHVVGSGSQFQITLSTGGQPLTASLVASFPPDDLAVIKVNGTLPVPPAKFADSSHLVVGQLALAMGSPLGLTASVTDGIVSALGRTVTESPGTTIADMVQTSAAINPGNSGGALVDSAGEVIGIPTLAAADQQSGGVAPGIGFAISANTAKRIADQIIATGKVTNSGRAALNISAATVVNTHGQAAGVGVLSVTPGGAADKAGIRAGDVIVKVNDTQVADITAFNEVLAGLSPGQQARITLDRGGQTSTVPATLGEL